MSGAPWGLLGTGGLAAIAAVVGLSSCHPDPKIKAAEDQAKTATAQSALNQNVTAVAGQTTEKTVHLEIVTKEAVRNVQIAPGASSPIPPDVARAWSDGIDRLRRNPAADGGNATGDDSAGH